MIFFRADGNSDIGSGHIMRCLSIADAGSIENHQSLFITADKSFNCTIKNRGYENIVLNSDYKKLFLDLPLIEKLIVEYCPSAFFVDSYYVSKDYLFRLRVLCQKNKCQLVYIDDILAFPYSCDILLNYNIYGDDKRNIYKNMYKLNKETVPRMLLGSSYAPLRKEFDNLPRRKVKKFVKDVLISTGGSDSEHIALKLAKYIVKNNEKLFVYHFHFIIGTMNNDKIIIEKLVKNTSNITLHADVRFMSVLMQQSDLAISAAGSTLYELCAAQTPTITYILADNQIMGAEGFVSRDVMQCVGDARELGDSLPEKLISAMLNLAERYEKRVRISQLQRKIVDGKGAHRIIEEISFRKSESIK